MTRSLQQSRHEEDVHARRAFSQLPVQVQMRMRVPSPVPIPMVPLEGDDEWEPCPFLSAALLCVASGALHVLAEPAPRQRERGGGGGRGAAAEGGEESSLEEGGEEEDDPGGSRWAARRASALRRAARQAGIPAEQGVALAEILATLKLEEAGEGLNGVLVPRAEWTWRRMGLADSRVEEEESRRQGGLTWRDLRVRLARIGFGYIGHGEYGASGGYAFEDFEPSPF
jgi:hypothetical protein